MSDLDPVNGHWADGRDFVAEFEWRKKEIERLRADAKEKYQRGIEVVAMNATKLKELKDEIERLQVMLKESVHLNGQDAADAYEDAAKWFQHAADLGGQ